MSFEIGKVRFAIPVACLGLLILLSACASARKAAPASQARHYYRLALYEVAEPVPEKSLMDGTAMPEVYKLVARPVFADGDFVAYDRTNHIISVSLEAARREHKVATSSFGEAFEFAWPCGPYVLVAGGERIFICGAWDPISSRSYRVPVIEGSMVPSYSAPSWRYDLTIRDWAPSEPNSGGKRHPLDDARIIAAISALRL